MFKSLRSILLLGVLTLGVPASLLAQMEEVTPGGMEAYRNVFIAYTVVWLLVGGWILSISRRLNAVAKRMDA
jgi:CcmD family protein